MVEMLVSQVLHSSVVDFNPEIKVGDGKNAYGVRCPKKTRRIVVLSPITQ
jgi:hypothetical protein